MLFFLQLSVSHVTVAWSYDTIFSRHLKENSGVVFFLQLFIVLLFFLFTSIHYDNIVLNKVIDLGTQMIRYLGNHFSEYNVSINNVIKLKIRPQVIINSE